MTPIKLSDGLPREGEEVLFFDKKWFTGYWSYRGYKISGGRIIWCSNCECSGYERESGDYEPTHWLPSPPKPREE